MLSPINIIFLLLFLTGPHVSCFEFKDPSEPGVVLGEKTHEAQLLYVDENNDGSEVTLVLITDAQNSLNLHVQSGEKDGLQPRLEKIDDTSYYLKGVRLDYEHLATESIILEIFEISIAGSSQFLNIHIVNLDDESPSLVVSLCEMDEQTIIDEKNSKCVFQASDPDGWLSYMTFDIIGSSNEADLFQFVYKDTPGNNTYQADVLLVLQDNQQLDFESVFIYTFIVAAKDSAGHTTIPVANISVVVEVIDIPDEPPVWTYFAPMSQITEKAAATLQVSAKDGDFGINNKINYRIDDDETGFVHIDTTTGIISIDPIDRDAGYDEVIFNITAYEKVDETSTLTSTMTLLVIDIDDHIPQIAVDGEDKKEFVIEVDEGSTIITDSIFAVSDLDIDENAVYTIQLKTFSDIDYTEAFELSASSGYKNTSLGLTAIDPQKLDFEDKDWKIITMEVYTQGTKTPSNNYDLSITINLKDINDEPPIFDEDEYLVAVSESVGKGTVVANIQATDLDAEDIENGVLHTILGIYNETLEIEEFGGKVSTIVDRAFDYQKEKEVEILIRAVDAVGHTAITQLIIQVLEVNENPPVLSLAPVQISVEENQANGSPLAVTIEAIDVDSTADLEFSINWTMSYATKSSIKINQKDFDNFLNCIDVETESTTNNNQASAKLSIKEVLVANTPDFEVFDTLFLQITVTDKNTEANNPSDSGILVIDILNINDNSPVFSKETTSIQNTVTENCKNGTIVGIANATDLDGDSLIYSIASGNEFTPSWIDINHEEGILFVNLHNGDIVDSDDPPRSSLLYSVTVSDGKFNVTTSIAINILDTNDNVPQLDNADHLQIEEDFGNISTHGGSLVHYFDSTDHDRDDPFRTVTCTFLPNRTDEIVLQTFYIENKNLHVLDGAVLDREVYPEYRFMLYCYDDPAHTGPISNAIISPPEITIQLMDVNDNYPEIINTDAIKISENDPKGEISEKLVGEDLDDGANGMITFDLISITRFSDADHTNKTDEVSQTLFSISSDTVNNLATLTIEEDLKGLYGYFQLLITTTDLGVEPLSKNNTVNLEVTRYNYREPMFLFPAEGIYLLNLTESVAHRTLIGSLGPKLPIKASDNDQNKYNIKFKIVTDSDEENIFLLKYLGDSAAKIDIDENITIDDISTDDIYNVTIRAYLDTDDIPTKEEASHSKDCNIGLQFEKQ